MRWLRRAADANERSVRLASAPLPAGSSISFCIPGSLVSDQDRIHLSSEMADGMRRVWGIVGTLRNESFAANMRTPASSQIVLRINWLGDRSQKFRNFLVRGAAYSASYDPRIATGKPCTLRIGEIVSGCLKNRILNATSLPLQHGILGMLANGAPSLLSR